MGKRKFIAATSLRDSEGDKIDLKGIKIPTKLYLRLDFKGPALGLVNANVEGGFLKIEGEIPEELLDYTPAIAFMPIKYTTNGKERDIHELALQEVDLCSCPNADKSIKTLREQLNDVQKDIH